MFSGSLVAIVTPMHADGGLDYEAWSRLIDLHLENGTSGIVVGGTTGESATLSDAELQELTQRACAQVRGRIQVITGAGTSSTATTVERVRWVSQLPVDGVLIVTPAYNRPTQEGLFRHYQAAAAASRAPVIAYNVPSRTAVDIAPETVARLRKKHANIVGVKETTKDFEHFSRVLKVAGRDTLVWSGIELLCLPLLALGGVGFVSATANLAPAATARMYEHWVNGDFEQARDLHFGLHPVTDVIFTETNPAAAKWVLAQAGLIQSGYVRPPLVPLTEPGQAKALALLREGAAVLPGPVAKVAM
jgi:4-hydroxy-tetrahydrodipicolinate synthase